MCFTQFSILIKVSWQKRYIGNSPVFIPLCLHSFNHLSLFFENLGIERTGGISKLVVVVDMVLNFFITDKSIMAKRSPVPSQVFKSKILVQKGQGKFGLSEEKSEVSKTITQLSLLNGPDWTKMLLMIKKKIPWKAWPTKQIYLNKEYPLN